MTDAQKIAGRLRAAFDGDSVPEKNIALRKAFDEIAHLTAALDEIANPIAAFKRKAEAEGKRIDGAMAYHLANDPEYLRGIARRALEDTQND